MSKHSVAIKIIMNDDTIEEIINPDFSACGSSNVVLKRNQPCKGDALDRVTTAAKSDQHAGNVPRKKLKYPGNDEQTNPIPSIPIVCLATSTNSKVSHAGELNWMPDLSLNSLPVIYESGSVGDKTKRRKRTGKHKQAKKMRQSSDREIKKLQRGKKQATSSLRKPFVQSKDPMVSSTLPHLDSCSAQASCVAEQKLPLSPSGPSVLKPCTSPLVHYNLINVNVLMEQKVAKVNAEHSRREATTLMQSKIKSTMDALEISKSHQAISFKDKDPQSTTSIPCQQSGNLGTVTTSMACQQSNSARTVVITPPAELIHVTPFGEINCSDIIKKGVLQLFDRNASQIVLLIHQKQARTYVPLPRRRAFRVTKREGTLRFEPTEFPPKKQSARGKGKSNPESLSSDMDVGERSSNPESLSSDMDVGERRSNPESLSSDMDVGERRSNPESLSSDIGVDKRKSPRDQRGSFTCNNFSDLGAGNELSATSGNSNTDLIISFVPGTTILTHDAAASTHCEVENVVSTGLSRAINSTVTNLAIFTRDMSSVSDPRLLQRPKVSFNDKCHLKTVEVTVHASADFDPKKQLSPQLAESNTTSKLSCKVTPTFDKHLEKSKESLTATITLQPITKPLQNLISASKPQATARPMQSLKCPVTSKEATEPEQTLSSPVLLQSTETTPTLSSPVVLQSAEKTPTLSSSVVLQSTETTPTLSSPVVLQSAETTPTLSSPVVPQSAETTPTLSSPVTIWSADKFQPFTLKKSKRLQKITRQLPSSFTNPASAEMAQSAHAGEKALYLVTDVSQLISSTPVNSTPATLADLPWPDKNTGDSSLVFEVSQPALCTSDPQPASLARVSGSHRSDSKSDKVSSDADENSVTSTNSFDSPLYQWTKSDVARWLNFHRLGGYASQFSEMDGPCMVELVHCLHASPVILQAYLKEFGFSLSENCRLLSLLRAFSKQVGLDS